MDDGDTAEATMTSTAAAKVFALPELLEKILIQLPWRTLYSILRTNTTFHDTITRSIKLRRRMHLEYKLPDEEHGIRVNDERRSRSVLHDLYFFTKLLKFGPFELDHGPAVEDDVYLPGEFEDEFVRNAAYEPIALLLVFRLVVPYSEKYRESSMGGQGGFSTNAKSASWRKMKLTHEPFPVRVKINFSEGVHFKEIDDFEAGEGTLGEVLDYLDSVRKRTLQEHKKRESGGMAMAMGRWVEFGAFNRATG